MGGKFGPSNAGGQVVAVVKINDRKNAGVGKSQWDGVVMIENEVLI